MPKIIYPNINPYGLKVPYLIYKYIISILPLFYRYAENYKGSLHKDQTSYV